jgi:hypothetical protein
MSKIKKCINCGKEFERTGTNQKYCKPCGAENVVKWQRDNYIKNRAMNISKQKRYNNTKRGRKARMRWNVSQLRQIHIFLYNKRRTAKKKNIPYTLTKEYVMSLPIPKICPILGIPIFVQKQKIGMHMDNSPSLDRIKPEAGYVPGNVRVISHRANRFKSDMTVKEARLVLKDLLQIEREGRR